MKKLMTLHSPKNYAGPITLRDIFEAYGDDGYKEYWVKAYAVDGSVKTSWKYGFKTFHAARSWAGSWASPAEYFGK